MRKRYGIPARNGTQKNDGEGGDGGLRGSGMEVAVHGLTHPFLEQLPVNLCTAEVIDRENLGSSFKTIVRGMAYPFTTSDMVVNTLMQSGISYARTTVSTGDFRLPSTGSV